MQRTQRKIARMILRKKRDASHACNATRELNPCSNFTQATQGLTNHMASFHLIVTARAPIGDRIVVVAGPTLLSNTPTIKLGRTGSCDEMIRGRVRTFHSTISIHLFHRAYEKLSLVQNLCLHFRRGHIFHRRSIPYIVRLHLPCNSSLRCVRCVASLRNARSCIACVA